MTLSRRSTIKAIGVVGTGSALAGTAMAVNEHQDDERNDEDAPDDDEEVGAIRVGHFSPDAPNVDVYVDEQRILSDVGYGELSPYLEIVPGTYTLTITAAGDDEPVYERTIVVDAEFYTAAAIGELEAETTAAGGGETGIAAEDDAAGNATATEDADVPATGAAIQEDGDDGIEFGNDTDGDTGFGNVTDENAAAGNDTAANETDVPDAPAEGEEDDATDAGTFEVLLLVDSRADDVEEGTAPLRFVHAVPDAPAVDIADGDTGARIFEDVGFTEPSGYVPADPGTGTLELFPADEGDLGGDAEDDAATNDTDSDDVISQPDPVVSVELELEADTAYTAYAIGYLEELDETELTVDEEEYATGDEFGEDGADGGDSEDDRSFSVRVAVDGEMDDESDADEEEGVEDDQLEPENGREADANESATDDRPEPAGGYNGSTGDERNGTDDHRVNESAAADD